jgi:diketogulonate reductase-like aldo/keto reductase
LDKYLTEHQEITWRAMEEIYEAGLAKAIGVSNWTIPGLQSMLQYAKIKPAMNQVEIHPLLPNSELLEFCSAHDILLSAYSPLGKLSEGKRLSVIPELTQIVKQHGHTLAQVLIAWG